jgi:hypothetical protein
LVGRRVVENIKGYCATSVLGQKVDWRLAMVTTRSLRRFSLDCLHWAGDFPNPCARQIIVDVARSWLTIANFIEAQSDGNDVPDLRSKLN